MKSRFFSLCSLLVLVIATSSFAQDAKKAIVPERHFAVLDRYCFECHDSDAEKGGIDLEALSFNLDSVEAAETWQKVLNVMNSGEMPPKKKPQLTFEEKSSFLSDLSHEIVVARELLSDTGGVITMRRLNRREYENTVEELLGVRMVADALPDDANSGGFDTSGAALFFSSDQFEQYLALAHKALDAAFVYGKQPKPLNLKRESEVAVNVRFERISAKLKADYDRAQEWRANSETKAPADYGFIDENDVKFWERLYNQQYETYRQYLDRPESKTGVLLNRLFNGAVVDTVTLPKNWPTGEYQITVKAAVLPGSKSHEQFLEYGRPGNGARSGELSLLGCVRVTGTLEAPQTLTIPVTVTKDGPRDFGFRQRQHNNRDAARAAFVRHETKTGVGPAPAVWIDSVEVSGPFFESWPPRGVSEVFFKGMWWNQDDEDVYAREVIERFAKRAFRIREPSDAFLEKLFHLYTSGKAEGRKFPEAIREPLAVVMASPGFLYLLEPVPGAERRELTDLELAVRLSYFLWSAPPDDALFEAAKTGKLKKPGSLAWHANRMLDDPRSDAFIASFAHQWLHMERLDFFQFDHALFEEFDDSAKESARKEVFETIRFILLEKRPLSDLLKSDYAVVNDVLADYYGIEGVTGSEFRQVSLPGDSPRGGLLGMAAIHAMGSDGTHSSIVERGTWVMRRLLNDPPPPAPPNVPQLSRVQGGLLSPREQLAAHMEGAQCANCHARIDPIGYGLQNFDATGKWREEMELRNVVNRKVRQKKIVPVDPTGQLPDGSAFANYFELRDLIAERDEAFSHSFAEALIEYALGRPYGFSDESLRERILERATAKDGQMREIVLALIQSKPFRTK